VEIVGQSIWGVAQLVKTPCLGRGPTDSNSSIPCFGFSVFSVIWGICFSVKDNPNGLKTMHSCTLRTGLPVIRPDSAAHVPSR